VHSGIPWELVGHTLQPPGLPVPDAEKYLCLLAGDTQLTHAHGCWHSIAWDHQCSAHFYLPVTGKCLAGVWCAPFCCVACTSFWLQTNQLWWWCQSLWSLWTISQKHSVQQNALPHSWVMRISSEWLHAPIKSHSAVMREHSLMTCMKLVIHFELHTRSATTRSITKDHEIAASITMAPMEWWPEWMKINQAS